MSKCSFTGKRPMDLYGYEDKEEYKLIITDLMSICKLMISKYNVTEFITGGAQGADQLAFWAVNKLKKDYHYENVENNVFRPFDNQDAKWSDTGLFSKKEYHQILSLADRVITIGSPTKESIMYRNYAMVDSSDFLIVIAATDKKLSGGTKLTYDYAKSKSKKILFYDPIIRKVKEPS